MFGAGVTEDGRYLIISMIAALTPKTSSIIKICKHPDSPVVELISEFEANYSFIDNEGSIFWFRTDLDAPRGRVIAIDINKPTPPNPPLLRGEKEIRRDGKR
jgi:prolyl oligopeptidase